MGALGSSSMSAAGMGVGGVGYNPLTGKKKGRPTLVMLQARLADNAANAGASRAELVRYR